MFLKGKGEHSTKTELYWNRTNVGSTCSGSEREKEKEGGRSWEGEGQRQTKGGSKHGVSEKRNMKQIDTEGYFKM